MQHYKCKIQSNFQSIFQVKPFFPYCIITLKAHLGGYDVDDCNRIGLLLSSLSQCRFRYLFPALIVHHMFPHSLIFHSLAKLHILSKLLKLIYYSLCLHYLFFVLIQIFHNCWMEYLSHLALGDVSSYCLCFLKV